MDRLYASAQVYQIDIPYSREELNEAICETIRRNDLKAATFARRPISTAAAWASAQSVR